MSSNLHTVSLAAHVADFRAALLDTASMNPHEALSLLQADAVAQVMSFVPYRKSRCAVRAVSPQTRLDSEVTGRARLPWESNTVIRASIHPRDAVMDEVPVFSIVTTASDYEAHGVLPFLWWASRCGLPVEVAVDDTDKKLRTLLDDTLRCRVTRLAVDVRRPLKSAAAVAAAAAAAAADEAAVAKCAFGPSALTSLLSFPHLQSLSVVDLEELADNPASVAVRRALETAASMSVAALSLDGWMSLHDLSSWAGSTSLKSLTVCHSGLRSLEDLLGSPMLERLAVSYCRHITSFPALASWPRLRVVELRGCDVRSLDGLDRCVALQEIDVSGNCHLQQLSALAGAPLLRRINASDCDIRSVDGLGSCAALTHIVLKGNENLLSLGDLSSAPCLEQVHASRCGLRDLGEAGPWSALREMDVSCNSNLQSLSGLSVAPRLQTIDARECGIRDLTALRTCTNLRYVHVTETDTLGLTR